MSSCAKRSSATIGVMMTLAMMAWVVGCGGEVIDRDLRLIHGAEPGNNPTSTTLPPPGPGCELEEYELDGFCYSAPGIKWLTYDSAKQLCNARGAQVATIASAAENQFVYEMLPPLTQGAFIGLVERQGQFVWDDGSASSYRNWGPDEPNNDSGNERCAIIWGPWLKVAELRGRWNDTPCDEHGRDTVICKRAR